MEVTIKVFRTSEKIDKTFKLKVDPQHIIPQFIEALKSHISDAIEKIIVNDNNITNETTKLRLAGIEDGKEVHVYLKVSRISGTIEKIIVDGYNVTNETSKLRLAEIVECDEINVDVNESHISGTIEKIIVDGNKVTNETSKLRLAEIVECDEINVDVNETFIIDVIFLNNSKRKFVISCSNAMTTRDLIEKIKIKNNIDDSNISLLFKGEILEKKKKLIDQELISGCSVTIIIKTRGA